jgi:hypothetical protein
VLQGGGVDPDLLDESMQAALRREVFALRRHTRARVFPPRIHVGLPSGSHDAVPDPSSADHALRTDLVAALLRQQTGAPGAWLTRVGFPELHDLDLAWWSAARSAFAEAETPLPWFVVITKSGWHRPETGEQRSWQRLRLR